MMRDGEMAWPQPTPREQALADQLSRAEEATGDGLVEMDVRQITPAEKKLTRFVLEQLEGDQR